MKGCTRRSMSSAAPQLPSTCMPWCTKCSRRSPARRRCLPWRNHRSCHTHHSSCGCPCSKRRGCTSRTARQQLPTTKVSLIRCHLSSHQQSDSGAHLPSIVHRAHVRARVKVVVIEIGTRTKPKDSFSTLLVRSRRRRLPTRDHLRAIPRGRTYQGCRCRDNANREEYKRHRCSSA